MALIDLASTDQAVLPVLITGLRPWWVAAAVGVGLLGAWRGPGLGMLLGLGVGAAGVAALWQAHPVAPPVDRGPEAAMLTVLSANVYVDHPDPAGLSAALSREEADVVVLPEAEARWAELLASPPWSTTHPHRVHLSDQGPMSLALLSRWPLTDVETLDLEGTPALSALLGGPHGPTPILAVHTLPPYRSDWIPTWHAQLQRIGAWMADHPAGLVVGDLNLTTFHRAHGRLLGTGDGWHDALATTAPLAATWPALPGPLGLMRLDHIWASRTAWDVTDGAVIPGRGSDHHGVRATLRHRPPAP